MMSGSSQQTLTYKLTDIVGSELMSASKARNAPDPNVRLSRELTSKLTMIQKTTFFLFNDLPSELTTDNEMIYARGLFKLCHEMDSDEALDYIMSYVNMMILYFPSQRNIIINAIKDNGYEIDERLNFKKFASLRGGVDVTDLEEYKTVNLQVMLASLGIYLILIGKRLTTLNSAQWLKNRTRTFCQSAGISEEDGNVERCCPSETFAISVYSFISPKFNLRKALFETIYSNSSSAGLTGKITTTCLTLLSGTEIGNFLLCHKFIIIENPILLCWQELAKYSPYLISAVEKFNSMGDKAMYCKFLYPQDVLQELSRDKLRIFAAIAREIAIMEGFTSFENYKGTDNSTTTRELVMRAIDIVKKSGGCNTRITQDMREALLAPKGNEEILAALSIGAFSQRKGEPTPIGATPFSN